MYQGEMICWVQKRPHCEDSIDAHMSGRKFSLTPANPIIWCVAQFTLEDKRLPIRTYRDQADTSTISLLIEPELAQTAQERSTCSFDAGSLDNAQVDGCSISRIHRIKQ